MPDPEFAERFLDAVGNELSLIDRALAGKLHDFITHKVLAQFIEHGAQLPCRIPGIADEVYHACYVGQLRARLIPGSPGVPATFGSSAPDGSLGGIYTNVVGATDPVYIVHRDDARRYLMALDLMPDPGTPQWCWLRGKPATEAKRLRPAQQDKADFQQLCVEHWERSPTTLIRGEAGIVALLGASYLRGYKEGTLEGWASAVAPAHVKRPGRPRKTTVEGQKPFFSIGVNFYR